MILLKGTAYDSQSRDTSPICGLIWVTQAETAIRSNQSQGSFANSLLIMHNTSVRHQRSPNTCIRMQQPHARTRSDSHTGSDWDRCTQPHTHIHTHTRLNYHADASKWTALYISVFSSGSACSPVQSNPTAVCPAASEPLTLRCTDHRSGAVLVAAPPHRPPLFPGQHCTIPLSLQPRCISRHTRPHRSLQMLDACRRNGESTVSRSHDIECTAVCVCAG